MYSYIPGKARVPYNSMQHSGRIQTAISQPFCIVMSILVVIVWLYFVIVMMFLYGRGIVMWFNHNIYKAAGLIMGKKLLPSEKT